MAYIDIIQPENAEGDLKKIYDNLRKSRGKIAEVHKIQSLNSKSITAHMDLYMTVMFGKSPLKRAQREMIAVVVSAANNCEYCQLYHGEALNHYWKDEKRVDQLRKDFSKLELSEVDINLCKLAKKLTLTPGQVEEADVESLKSHGLSDRAVLDSHLVISYFNFVNRMVMGLGVEIDVEEVGGYKY